MVTNAWEVFILPGQASNQLGITTGLQLIPFDSLNFLNCNPHTLMLPTAPPTTIIGIIDVLISLENKLSKMTGYSTSYPCMHWSTEAS